MDVLLLLEILMKVVGGLGIFLLGMSHMSEGMQAVAGARLRHLIGAVTDNRFLALLVGIVITCVVQSSSVTTVMVVGLVNSTFMTLMQAIGVIFGANIGTTITGWILTLKIGKYGLPILGVAALVYLFSRRDRVRYLAMVFMGIGMIFFGLELMSGGFKPLREAEGFVRWLHAFQATSYPGVLKCALAGCLLTMIVQSSSATLGITMSLAATGVIEFPTAAALVLGENIGTTITAYLASLGANVTAKRAAYAHMLFNVLGVIWITAVFPYYLRLILVICPVAPDLAVLEEGVETYPHVFFAIAAVHTGFNVANTLLFLPFMGLVARMVTWMVPDKTGPSVSKLKYFDVRLIGSPALGIAQSRTQLEFMANSCLKMMDRLHDVMTNEERDEAIERKIFQREEILDGVQHEITVFLGELLSGHVSHEDTRQCQMQLRMADEYESISDYVVSVLKLQRKMWKFNQGLTDDSRADILQLHTHVRAYLKLVNRCMAGEMDELQARVIADGQGCVRLMKAARHRHMERISTGTVDPLVNLCTADMLNGYRRMVDHGHNIVEVAKGEK